MAMAIPITTNTTIATCVQSQNGDMPGDTVLGSTEPEVTPRPPCATIV
jgi:hypothetical protein